MNNCKNCGTPVVPGELRCPTCNIPYADTDALKVDVKMPNMSGTLLEKQDKGLPPEVSAQEGLRRLKNPTIEEEEAYDPDAIIPIAPPSSFEETQMPTIPQAEIGEENKVETESFIVEGYKKVDKGSNKLFVVMASLILLGGVGFFLYGTFIDPEIYDKILSNYLPNDELKEVEITEEAYESYLSTEANISDVKFVLEYGLSMTHNFVYDEEAKKIKAIINRSTKNGQSNVFEGQTKVENLMKKLDGQTKYTIKFEPADDKFLYLVIFETPKIQILDVVELNKLPREKGKVNDIIDDINKFKVFFSSVTAENTEDGKFIEINLNAEQVENNAEIQNNVSVELSKLDSNLEYDVVLEEADEMYKITIKEVKSTE